MNPSAPSASADRSSSSNARKEGTRSRENPEQRLVMLHTKRLIFSLAGSRSSFISLYPRARTDLKHLIFFATTSHLTWPVKELGRSMSHSPGPGSVNFRRNRAKGEKKSGVRDPFSQRSTRTSLFLRLSEPILSSSLSLLKQRPSNQPTVPAAYFSE